MVHGGADRLPRLQPTGRGSDVTIHTSVFLTPEAIIEVVDGMNVPVLKFTLDASGLDAVDVFLGGLAIEDEPTVARAQLDQLAAAVQAAYRMLDPIASPVPGPDEPDDEPTDEPASSGDWLTDARLADGRTDDEIISPASTSPYDRTITCDDCGAIIGGAGLGSNPLVHRHCQLDGCTRPPRNGLAFCLVHDQLDPASPLYVAPAPLVVAEPWGQGDGPVVAVFSQAHPMTEAELRAAYGDR